MKNTHRLVENFISISTNSTTKLGKILLNGGFHGKSNYHIFDELTLITFEHIEKRELHLHKVKATNEYHNIASKVFESENLHV